VPPPAALELAPTTINLTSAADTVIGAEGLVPYFGKPVTVYINSPFEHDIYVWLDLSVAPMELNINAPKAHVTITGDGGQDMVFSTVTCGLLVQYPAKYVKISYGGTGTAECSDPQGTTFTGGAPVPPPPCSP